MKRPPRPIERWLMRLGRQDVAWARQRSREYRRYGYRLRELAAELAAAFVDLQVRPMSDELGAAVVRAKRYVEQLGEQRTPELIAEWPAIHAELMRGRDSLDSWLPA
jgi:hypothetical protein